MKDNKRIIIATIVIILLLATILLVIFFQNKNISDNKKTELNDLEEIDKNQLSYKDNVTIEQLKNEIGATGNTDIYEIQEEFDGRNIITVKPSIRYKVAFAGMIKKSKPNINEIDNILDENMPKKNGIWINEDSRDKILEILYNEKVNSKYTIDGEGYLRIQDKNEQNDNDKRMEQIINGEKQYILDVSSVCYIVDDITGEILDYNFEKMDKYQTYEYFEDNNKFIIFVTENTNDLLSKTELFESILELL